MSLFLSTLINKIDKKGRVSIPSGFRASLTQGELILFRSPTHQCLEGFDVSFMNEVSDRLDHFDLFSEEQDSLAMSIFGESVSLTLDETGRVVLPSDLIVFAGLTGVAAFVGMGRKFQVWSPERLEERKKVTRSNVQSQKLAIPKSESSGGIYG